MYVYIYIYIHIYYSKPTPNAKPSLRFPAHDLESQDKPNRVGRLRAGKSEVGFALGVGFGRITCFAWTFQTAVSRNNFQKTLETWSHRKDPPRCLREPQRAPQPQLRKYDIEVDEHVVCDGLRCYQTNIFQQMSEGKGGAGSVWSVVCERCLGRKEPVRFDAFRFRIVFERS